MGLKNDDLIEHQFSFFIFRRNELFRLKGFNIFELQFLFQCLSSPLDYENKYLMYLYFLRSAQNRHSINLALLN